MADKLTMGERWVRMSALMRSGIILAGISLVVLGVGLIMRPAQVVVSKVQSNGDGGLTIGPGDPGVTSELGAAKMTQLQQQLAQKEEQINELKRRMDAPVEKGNPEIDRKIELLAAQIEAINRAKPELDKPLPVIAAPKAIEPMKPEIPAMRSIGGVAPPTKVRPPEDAAPIAYMPPGSFFEAVLISGMDAPASSADKKDPMPALARVKADAILPNAYMYNVRECFVLVGGHGDLSSRRAFMRSETLSCVGDGGKVFEGKMDAFVVGEDGKVGIAGHLVSKQGQIIAQSFLAGIIGGFGTAVTPVATQGLNVGGQGTTYSQPGMETIAQTAVGQGVGVAAKSASQFFLDMAKKMTPVVEISSGTKVTFVLTKGLEVRLDKNGGK
jgi:conjugal transfer pilus assembly protein TraB